MNIQEHIVDQATPEEKYQQAKAQMYTRFDELMKPYTDVEGEPEKNVPGPIKEFMLRYASFMSGIQGAACERYRAHDDYVPDVIKPLIAQAMGVELVDVDPRKLMLVTLDRSTDHHLFFDMRDAVEWRAFEYSKEPRKPGKASIHEGNRAQALGWILDAPMSPGNRKPTASEIGSFLKEQEKALKEAMEEWTRMQQAKQEKAAKTAEVPNNILAERSADAAGIPTREAPLAVLRDPLKELTDRLEQNTSYAGRELPTDVAKWNANATQHERLLVTQVAKYSGTPLRTTGTREEEIRILQETLPQGPVLLESTYRSGVSTLLTKLEADGHYTGGTNIIEQTRQDFYGGLGRIKGGDPELQAVLSAENDPIKRLLAWDKYLGEKGQRGLIASTEAAVINLDEDVAKQKSFQRVLDVLASLKHIDVIVNQQHIQKGQASKGVDYKGFTEITLPPLNLQDITTYIGEELSSQGALFDAELPKKMLEATGGRAILIGALLALLGEDLFQTGGSTFTGDGLQKIVALLEGGKEMSSTLEHDCFKRPNEYLSKSDVDTLRAIARTEGAHYRADELKTLIRLGFVSQNKDGAWCVSSSLHKARLLASKES